MIGTIPTEQVAVSFEPTENLTDVNGELTFGGTDSTKFTGPITFTCVILLCVRSWNDGVVADLGFVELGL